MTQRIQQTAGQHAPASPTVKTNAFRAVCKMAGLTAYAVPATLVSSLLTLNTAFADIINVISGADAGPGTLRAAIILANDRAGADEITFAANINTISVTSSPLAVTDTLTITGTGSESLEIKNEITTSNALFRNDTTRLTLSGFTLRQAPGSTATPIMIDDDPGNITVRNVIFLGNNAAQAAPQFAYVTGGSLTLQNSELNGNSALDETSSAIDIFDGNLTVTDSAILGFRAESGAAILSDSSQITVSNSTLSGNTASQFGGAISSLTDTLTISGTLITQNKASEGGAISTNNSSLSVSQSLVTANTTSTNGGALWATNSDLKVHDSTFSNNKAELGGAHYLINPKLVAANSTFSGNRATLEGGALYIDQVGDLNISSSTLVDNIAGTSGGGLFVANISDTTFVNSVLARNSAGDGPNIFGSGKLSHTLVSNNADANLTALKAGNLIGTPANPIDAGLGALTDNGGIRVGNAGNRALTTHKPLANSPLIDAGDNAAQFAASALAANDQRGNGFPRISDSTLDIGALERQFTSTPDAPDAPDTTGSDDGTPNDNPNDDTDASLADGDDNTTPDTPNGNSNTGGETADNEDGGGSTTGLTLLGLLATCFFRRRRTG